ncbi:MAG: hypothetical protein V1650_01320 [Candidatus Omnitrophota bacterium]
MIKKSAKDNKSFPKHVIFCFVDHFEPGNPYRDRPSKKALSLEEEIVRMDTWAKCFPEIAFKHKDSDGCFPKHGWFLPPHYDKADHLKRLVDLCKMGLGEVEMHLHHELMPPFPDTYETLKKKIEFCIESFSRYGVFVLADGRRRYGFIHGNWALDNSLEAKLCGANYEIKILAETGCFADFSFPSLNKSQPATVNKFYYVKDDTNKPKSYNYGKEVVVGGKPWGDLMLVQGGIGLRWRGRSNKLIPSIDVGCLDGLNTPSLERMDYWVDNAITVKGRPDWLFVKVFCHGTIELNLDNMFGKFAEQMYSYLETKYNDGKKYALHYVSAREMYNLIKAAEAGLSGNPNQFRDFEIPKYVYL